MAQKLQVINICDKCEDEVDELKPYSVTYDRREYQTELCSKCAAKKDRAIEAVLQDMGMVRGTRSGSPRRTASQRRTSDGDHSASDIRNWARENGIEVSEKGRISASVREQYEAAVA